MSLFVILLLLGLTMIKLLTLGFICFVAIILELHRGMIRLESRMKTLKRYCSNARQTNTIMPQNNVKTFRHLFPIAMLVLGTLTASCIETPMIPGTEWRVHDINRPQPPIVTPAPEFSHQASPPPDAIVLFDGTDLSQWETMRGRDANWKVEDGYMEVRGGDIRTRKRWADLQLHLEFATPTEVRGDGQDRGNSGVFFHGRYEVQILDSYDNPTYPDGQAAALYGQMPPLVNASKPPGKWQTFDIIFESPRWDDDHILIKKAKVTVIHNGITVHNRQEFFGVTRHRALGDYLRPHPPEGFIRLQDHGDPVRFRNIWVRPLDTEPEGALPEGEAE